MAVGMPASVKVCRTAARFGTRMTGEGVFAELIRQRFDRACARLGLQRRSRQLRTDLFAPPAPPGEAPTQMDLFKP